MTDKSTIIRPCTLVYLLLLILTFITWYIGVSGMSGIGISLAVLGLALIKGQMIGDYFMGLKAVSGFWRWVVFIWLFVPGGLITIAFMNAAT